MPKAARLVLASLVFASNAGAHPGGLDSSGGHHDRKHGGYHTHRASYASSRPSLDELPPPPPISVASESRSAFRTAARQAARTQARERIRREARNDHSWHYYEWKRGDLARLAADESSEDANQDKADEGSGGEAFIETKEATPSPAFVFLEQFHEKRADGVDVSRFVVALAGDSADQMLMGCQLPVPGKVSAHLLGLKYRKAIVLYYLNGMPLSKTAWGHAEVKEEQVDIRFRGVSDDEFRRNYLVVDKLPKRTWTDASGRFRVTANLVARSSNVVTLRNDNGRIIKVDVGRLSAADQEYLKTAMKFGRR